MTLTKPEARLFIKHIIRQRNHDEYQEKSLQVRDRVRSLLESQSAGRVLLYNADEKMHEVDLSSLESSLPQFTFDYAGSSASAPFPVGVYDHIFVPLFGFSIQGYRLGRGAGWYDKFLATQPEATLYGIGFEDICIDFKNQPHDIKMHYIITELQMRTF